VEPGKLNRRIDIFGNSVISNELGETDFSAGKIKTIWAAVIPQTGKLQTQEANTILSNVTHKIIVRYEAAKDITQDMFIMYQGHRLNIKYILNPFFANVTIEIFCEEVIE
jgi:SPP1 family predicted phage head-tail adaptor